MQRESDPTAAANALVDAANAAGGEDNITVVVLDARLGRSRPPAEVRRRRDHGPRSHCRRLIRTRPAESGEVVGPPAVTVVTSSTSRDAASTESPDSSEPESAGSPTGLPAAPPRDTASYRDPRPRRRIGRGIGRVLLFAVPILVIVGVAIGTIGWYAKNSYFVGAEAGKVVVYRGRPGGLLFWDPEIVERTGIGRSRLSDDFRQGVDEEKEFSSKNAALAYVGRARGSAPADDHHVDEHVDHDGPGGDPTPRAVSTTSALARFRRTRELSLGALALIIIGFGDVLLALSKAPALPPDLWAFLGALFGLFVCAHLAVRRLAPRADSTLLPIAALLLGIGFITISRLDLAEAADDRVAPAQAVWAAVGVGAFVLTLLVVRTVRSLARYRYTFLLLGIAALVLPLLPGIGVEINGARLWVRIAGATFQPGEFAKVLLVIFFAGYLVEKRELLTSGSRRLGRMHLPDPKHLGPLLVPWAVSIVIMVLQKDLGSSLLFFTVFLAILYIATQRVGVPVGGLRALRRCRGVLVPDVRPRAGTREHLDQSLVRRTGHRVPAHAEPVRVRQRRLRRSGARTRQPRRHPGGDDRLHLRGHR